jgi:quercetin dioxygenase-like cupin family protein
MSHFFPTQQECGHHDIFKGISIATCAGEKMLVSVVELAANSVVEEHAHPHEQMGMWLEGEARFFIGGEEKTVRPGDLYRIPGNVRHKVLVLDKPARAIDIFCPVREEYR